MKHSSIARVITAAIFISSTAMAQAASTTPDADNLAGNPDFELPPGATGAKPNDWIYFTSKDETLEIITTDFQSGIQSIQLSAQGAADAYQGLNQTISVTPKEKYSFTAHVKNSKDNPLKGQVEGKLVIEWLDKLGREIERSESTTWSSSLSKSKWREVEIKNVRAPKDAVRARFGIMLVESVGGKGSFFADNVLVSTK